MTLSDCLKNWGDSILEPSEQVRNVFKPKSNPAILPVVSLISGSSMLSTTTTKNNSPSGVRLMVKVLTFPSISLEFQY
jgi:hypothetical protein